MLMLHHVDAHASRGQRALVEHAIRRCAHVTRQPAQRKVPVAILLGFALSSLLRHDPKSPF